MKPSSETVAIRKILLWATLALAFSTFLPPTSLAGDRKSPDRIVAMGDIHGDFAALSAMLKQTGLVDESLRWIGGSSCFVQLGDFTDRGPQVRETMDLLIRLQDEAPRHGGCVVVLMGNHEMMNIVGDYRYVPTEIYANFADDRSDERRREAFKSYLKWRKLRSDKFGDVEERDGAELESGWMEAHPPGYLEYGAAMGPDGVYGKWLRKLPVVVKMGGTIFLHGGIHPSHSNLDLEEMNKRVKKERELHDTLRKYLVDHRVIEPYFDLGESFKMAKQQYALFHGKSAWGRSSIQSGSRDQMIRILEGYLKMGDWLSMRQDGPLWFRGFANWTDEEGSEALAKLLEEYDAQRFVVGHTIVNDNKISTRFNLRLVLVDTLEPSALIIQDSQLAMSYLASDDPSVPRSSADPSAGPMQRAQ